MTYIYYNGEFNYCFFCIYCRNWYLKQESVFECRICSGNVFQFFVPCTLTLKLQISFLINLGLNLYELRVS